MDPLKMYFLLKMEIFQPAMLVYRGVTENDGSESDNFRDEFPKALLCGGMLLVQFGSWFDCRAHLFRAVQLDFHDNNFQSRQRTEANQKYSTILKITLINLKGSILTSWWFHPIWEIWSSNWIISPHRDEQKYLKPPPSYECQWMSLGFCCSHDEL